MEMFIPTLILTVAVLAFVFAGIGIRILLKKNGEFVGTCATNNPMLTNQIGECTVCGKKPDEECQGDGLAMAK